MTDKTGITSDGRSKVVIVTTLADPSAPKLSELTATSVVDISELVTSDGLDQTTNEATVSDHRLSDTEDYERRGRVSHGLELTYARAKDTTADLAFTTLTPGLQAWAVIRQGEKYYDAPFEADDEVDVIAFEAGARRKVKNGENEVFKRIQKLFVRTKSYFDVKVVAP